MNERKSSIWYLAARMSNADDGLMPETKSFESGAGSPKVINGSLSLRCGFSDVKWLTIL
ncbi:hypothetical protein PSYAC_12401 [Pseudomonas syringae pv. actinidiae str. M302091]|nr:hypothetical protein PSYAC_12401 [Pseudomonas syringae pv. actinidiae str. M302091]